MTNQVEKLITKHSINVKYILYIIRKTQRTYIYMKDGECHETLLPVKTIAEALSPDDFWSIQKGILVSKKYIVNIDSAYRYTMINGTVFEGRHRTPGEHQRHRRELFGEITPTHKERTELTQQYVKNGFLPELTLQQRCAIMEDAPIAFCVIELVFNEDGHSIDFVFRYCNKEMAVLEGIPVNQMINKSFYEVFPNGDKKWIIPYADVALNGKAQIIRDYSPEIDKHLTIRCFQPMKGYCACILEV